MNQGSKTAQELMIWFVSLSFHVAPTLLDDKLPPDDSPRRKPLTCVPIASLGWSIKSVLQPPAGPIRVQNVYQCRWGKLEAIEYVQEGVLEWSRYQVPRHMASCPTHKTSVKHRGSFLPFSFTRILLIRLENLRNPAADAGGRWTSCQHLVRRLRTNEAHRLPNEAPTSTRNQNEQSSVTERSRTWLRM